MTGSAIFSVSGINGCQWVTWFIAHSCPAGRWEGAGLAAPRGGQEGQGLGVGHVQGHPLPAFAWGGRLVSHGGPGRAGHVGGDHLEQAVRIVGRRLDDGAPAVDGRLGRVVRARAESRRQVVVS